MKPVIIAFFTTLIPLVAIDAVWLTIMGKNFYRPHIGHLMADTINLVPVVIFYLVYTAGLLHFVVMPAIQQNASNLNIFFSGAAFGFIAYAAYDFTNQATLKDWSTIVTIVDLAWGTLLAGTASLIAASCTKYFS